MSVHDPGWLGVVLGVLAGYFLSVLANLTSPSLKNWWAERSKKSTKKRIEKLEAQLAELTEKYPELDETVAQGLVGISIAVMLGLVAVLMILVGLGLQVRAAGHRDDEIVFIACALMILALTLGLQRVLDPMVKFTQQRSPMYRNALRKSIEKLEKRLG
jgi:hypothetical protein